MEYPYQIKKGIDFDDVLLIPQLSTKNSRGDVDISVDMFGAFRLEFPAIASPMRGIVDANFCELFANAGGIGILHRFYDNHTEWYHEAEVLAGSGEVFGLSIGLNDPAYLDFAGFKPNILLIDVANGYMSSLHLFCQQVKEYLAKHSPNTLLMAGNVATRAGADALMEAGVDLIRVGIGSGGLCSTRNITGVGVPQLTAIADCTGLPFCYAVADGGIRNSGDMVKAFAFGADVVMIGSVLAQTYESPADNSIYGSASRKLQEMQYSAVKSVEGIEKVIQKKGSLAEFIEEWSWGLRSACTYMDCASLTELPSKAQVITVGTNSLKKAWEI